MDVLRTQNFGLTQFPFTDAYVQAGASPPAYADAITAGKTIKASHLNELRSGIGGLE